MINYTKILFVDFKATAVITSYFRSQLDLFTAEDFIRDMKKQGIKISKDDAEEVLHSSNYVFPLVNNQFITRAGVFTGRWFSFKPTKEEIEKGSILIGHRCMPFVNPEVPPDSIVVKNSCFEVESAVTTFSMNLAMDVFALFGEGYIIPYIFNDKGNQTLPLTSVQYNLPTEITLTSWSLGEISEGEKVEFGDRLVCRVVDWENSVVQMFLHKDCMKKMMVSDEAIEREEWYSHFEQGLLDSFEKHGPSESIEEQLALLFLENQEQLCSYNCGSIEEFLAHTTKIGFELFGVETRIWRKGEVIPYCGSWNSTTKSSEILLSEMAMSFSPMVMDAYLEDNIYNESKKKESKSIEDIVAELFPQNIKMGPAERKILLLNLEKRNDILKKNYNRFSDYSVADIRKRVIKLFTQVSNLFCTIGSSGINVDVFPQQELIILSQLFGHMIRLLEEIENVFLRNDFPIADVSLSLDGMEDTFDDIRGTLKSALEMNRYKAFEIVQKE